MKFRIVIVVLGLMSGTTLYRGSLASTRSLQAWMTDVTTAVSRPTSVVGTPIINCTLAAEQADWVAQAGQDRYLWDRLFSHDDRFCGRGTFVEFGARDGIEHSNTYVYETKMYWKGLLFEVDPSEYGRLEANRPRSQIVHGAVCPQNQSHVPIIFSKLPGWTGSSSTYDLKRSKMVHHIREVQNVSCYSLAQQLRQHNLHRVDLMTIDTEGSELEIVLDFPWDEFDVRVVQIEQLDPRRYPSQKGRFATYRSHLQRYGYKLLSVFQVTKYDTHDLIFVRNVDDLLAKGVSHPSDGGDLPDERGVHQRAADKIQNRGIPHPRQTSPLSNGLAKGLPLSELTNCTDSKRTVWTAQAGQDKYLWDRLFSNQDLCSKGTFVEFGARNGIEHSNTYMFETFFGWTGLLFEVDPREYTTLETNRPRSDVIRGAVCPRNQTYVPIMFSKLGGWTGSSSSYEPKRSEQTQHIREVQNVTCYSLANELRKRNLTRIDLMTIDTEGSELDIVLDFPWDDFDVRTVQIEQLDARQYPSQLGRMHAYHKHLTSFGYKLLSVYEVARMDTHDLIYVRNVDDALSAGNSHPRDGGKLIDDLISRPKETEPQLSR